MSLQIKNTKELCRPDKFKWKVLVIAPPGFGKTLFMGTCPNIGVAACESGSGKGLLTIADRGVEYVEPSTKSDLEAFCKGTIFKDKFALGCDSTTDMFKTFIKTAALAIPRKQGESDKRRAGVPELDDYGVMASMLQDLLRALINQEKHVICTAGLRIQQPDMETGKGEYLVGPDLPGQLFLGAPAMFDTVMVGRTRQIVQDVKDEKTGLVTKKKTTERYWITQPDNVHIAKCRSKRLGNAPLLDPQEVYNIDDGRGTWPYLFAKIQGAYTELYNELNKEVK